MLLLFFLFLLLRGERGCVGHLVSPNLVQFKYFNSLTLCKSHKIQEKLVHVYYKR